jgi:hypothetical protein
VYCDCALHFSAQPAVYVKTELTGGYNKLDGLEKILMSKDVEVVTLKDVAIGKWDRDQVKLNATNMHCYHRHHYHYYYHYYCIIVIIIVIYAACHLLLFEQMSLVCCWCGWLWLWLMCFHRHLCGCKKS